MSIYIIKFLIYISVMGLLVLIWLLSGRLKKTYRTLLVVNLLVVTVIFEQIYSNTLITDSRRKGVPPNHFVMPTSGPGEYSFEFPVCIIKKTYFFRHGISAFSISNRMETKSYASNLIFGEFKKSHNKANGVLKDVNVDLNNGVDRLSFNLNASSRHLPDRVFAIESEQVGSEAMWTMLPGKYIARVKFNTEIDIPEDINIFYFTNHFHESNIKNHVDVFNVCGEGE